MSTSGSPRRSTWPAPSRSAAMARGSSCARSWKKQRLTWPSPTGKSGGFSVWQTSSASAQRSANTQPGRSAPIGGQVAGDRVEAAVVLAHAAARDAAQQARRCRGGAGRAAPVSASPSSTISPAYSTPTREHILRITPRLWLMKSTAVWNSACRLRDEVEHLGLDRRVEAGRRLVEDQQRGVDAERHRDHDALLHAARELVRVALHDRGRVGDLHLPQHRQRALVAPRACSSRAP